MAQKNYFGFKFYSFVFLAILTGPVVLKRAIGIDAIAIASQLIQKHLSENVFQALCIIVFLFSSIYVVRSFGKYISRNF